MIFLRVGEYCRAVSESRILSKKRILVSPKAHLGLKPQLAFEILELRGRGDGRWGQRRGPIGFHWLEGTDGEKLSALTSFVFVSLDIILLYEIYNQLLQYKTKKNHASPKKIWKCRIQSIFTYHTPHTWFRKSRMPAPIFLNARMISVNTTK